MKYKFNFRAEDNSLYKKMENLNKNNFSQVGNQEMLEEFSNENSYEENKSYQEQSSEKKVIYKEFFNFQSIFYHFLTKIIKFFHRKVICLIHL